MNGQQLKNSILQMVVEGKLVPQNENDEPASILIDRIAKEKEQLVKDKKIKKDKNISRIFKGEEDGLWYEEVGKGKIKCIEEELPFEVPTGWSWARLKNIGYNNGQMKPTEKFCYIDIGSIDNINQKLNIDENIIIPDKAPSRARKIVLVDDILYSTVRPYLHNMCIVDREFTFKPIASTGFAVISCFKGVYNKYLFNYMLSPNFDRYVNHMDNSKGVAYPAINDERLYKALIPLPPLAEQSRIVAKIEELLPLVDDYGIAHSKLEKLNSNFPKDFKKSILQWAIQGKLVPQDENDEPASALIDRIAKEKEQLVKDKKIKKDKNISRIFRGEEDGLWYEEVGKGVIKCIEEELPFEVPKGWSWARLGICLDVRDGTHDTPKYVDDGYPLITSKNLINGSIDFSTARHISKEDMLIINSRSKVDNHDILFAMIGSIGNPVLYFGNDLFSIKNMALFKQIEDNLDMKYIFWYLYFCQNQMKKEASGGVQSFVSLTYLRNFFVPLPPLAEQSRIVQKLEEILNEVDKL